MRVVLSLCLVVSVLQGAVQCDHHHQNHNGNHKHQDHHEKEHKEHQHPAMDKRACHKIAGANTEFAFNLYKQIAESGSSDNVFFSPLSISTAMSMLSLGARSTTKDQIVEGLGLNITNTTDKEIHEGFHHLIHMLNDANSDLQLNTGNVLFISEDLKMLPTFLEDVKNYYESNAFTTDFKNEEEAKKQINDHVEKKTNGKIVDLLQSVDQSALMVLVNFIVFKGKWEKVFDPKLTKEDTFFVDENTTVRVPMMEQEGSIHTWKDREMPCTVVRLNYAGNASAFFILPDEGKMKQVEEGLSAATLQKWRHTDRERRCSLHIPKFSISATCDLKKVLLKVGMIEVFSDIADLSRITGQRNLKASKAVHKAMLSIDEQGTEAAGATAVEIKPRFIPRPVILNRPFLFLLYGDITESLLFMGRINNPTQT
ncbi:alpha-1-antiproteinase F-like [Ambystoma mexicanum]|uniref:alpha-1-antiproteinase F-like n=1 Tax=Ambystoma mexicanum TaxID=8296 RepID=UPI0037E9357B